jgi:hypothetical protein
VAIRGNQRQSVRILSERRRERYQRPSGAIGGHPEKSGAVRGHQSLTCASAAASATRLRSPPEREATGR